MEDKVKNTKRMLKVGDKVICTRGPNKGKVGIITKAMLKGMSEN